MADRTLCKRCEKVHACARCSGADTEAEVVREARAAALEEAAKVCEREAQAWEEGRSAGDRDAAYGAELCAEAIRTLAAKERGA